MKKIFILLCLFVLTTNLTIAKDYSLNFNGDNYRLLYSVKNKDFGGYLNEYYKRPETYNIWTEMVAVHHFPNAYSPIDRVKDFRDYLTSMNCPSSLTFDDKKNSAIIDFVVINDKHLPVVLEFNVFKYEKSDKCGSVALQYARRYAGTTAMEIEEIKRDFEKNRKRMVKKVKSYKIPEVVAEDIDKCKVEYKSEDDKEIQKSGELNVNTQESTNLKEESKTDDEIIEVNEDKDNADNKVEQQNNTEENNSDNSEKDITKADNITSEGNTEKNTANPSKDDNVSKGDTEVKEIIIKAPIPDAASQNQSVKEDKKQKVQKPKKVKNIKQKKEKSYQVINAKDEYYTRDKKPRTVKKTKDKPYKVINTKDEYYRDTKVRKVSKKKSVKDRAKKADKMLIDEI